MVEIATVIASDNQLSEEEKKWVHDLAAAAKEAGVQARNNFWLASFALTAKGDVKKGLRRMKNWQRAEELYNLSEVDADEATTWFKHTFPSLMVEVGRNKDNLQGFGIRNAAFNPTLLKSHQDWQYYLKTCELNLQGYNPTLAHVRRGIANLSLMTGWGWSNLSMDAEKKISSIYQDAFPVKLKEIYFVEPPTILMVLFKVIRVFLKKKIVERIRPIHTEQLSEHFESSQLPPVLGGTLAQDFWAVRDQGLQRYQQSVKELQQLL